MGSKVVDRVKTMTIYECGAYISYIEFVEQQEKCSVESKECKDRSKGVFESDP